MKKIFTLLLLFSCTAIAKKNHTKKVEEVPFDETSSFFKKGECFWPGAFYYIINQKIDKNHYAGVVGLNHAESAKINSHAVFELNYISMNGPYLMSTIEYIGTKEMPLNNGFDVSVDFFKECTLPPK